MIGYLASAVNVVSFNPGFGPSLRIKILLFLLSICAIELISFRKIMAFFLLLPSVNENSERESNTMA